MHKLLAATALVLVPGAFAQSVSPSPFFATRDGDLSMPYVFTQPSRQQQIHGDLIGNPMVLQSLTFRRDGSANGTAHAVVPGKTITLSIVLADSVDCSAATNTFANNVTGNAVTVFSGTVSTPAIWGVTAKKSPTDFDFQFPITPWFYAGAGSFLWDATSSATSDNTRINLDAAQSAFPLFSLCSYEMHGTGCPLVSGPFELRGTGQNLGGLGAYTVGVTATGMPTTTPGVWIVGFLALDLPIPGVCANLWPQYAVSVPTTSDATGKATPYFQVPSNPAWLGLPMEMQMAYADASLPFPVPVALSNGLTYRVEPMEPAFNVCSVVTGTPGNATGTLLTTRAAIVRFN
ncbi:MAG: hypothetical protein U1F36_19750 [Planctomycetota bacterium]